MADLSLQFHMTSAELERLIVNFVDEFNLNVAVIRWRPFQAREISSADLPTEFSRVEQYPRWAFGLTSLVLSAADELEFMDLNPDHLRLDWGLLTPAGLQQSWISARTSNTHAMTIWRKVAAQIRKTTTAGMTASDPQTGASTSTREFRFSTGAVELERRGIPLLPRVGKVSLKSNG